MISHSEVKAVIFMVLAVYAGWIGVSMGSTHSWVGVVIFACATGWCWSKMWEHIEVNRKRKNDASSREKDQDN